MKPTQTRLDRYRQKHSRIDYYPSPDVMDIIKYHQANIGEPVISGVLDILIRAGHRIISGNRGNR